MHLIILGGTPERRLEAAGMRLARDASGVATVALDASVLPFVRPDLSALRARSVFIADVERAFPNQQQQGTRLVLTQSIYLVQKLIDLVGDEGRIVMTGDRSLLMRDAPEVFAARGPWSRFEAVDIDRDPAVSASDEATDPERAHPHLTPRQEKAPPATGLLVRAYSSPSPDERLQLCRDAAIVAPDSAIAALALASACRERQDLEGSRQALDQALRLAPDWEAAHYEDGKFWLGADDMERARHGFARASALMPTFSAAFSNLGATLGELGEPGAALAAFTRALSHDPHSFTILNNIGVVTRELGRLGESEASLRQVVALAPDFVFGHYNLGHTLFLAGRYAESLAAYEEGQRRDPEKNRRQGCRLAAARFANGDLEGADRDLWRFANEAPSEEREELLLETYEIIRALADARPDLDPSRLLLDRIAREIASPPGS